MITVNLGRRSVGSDQPCFVLAEVGVNHNGRVDLAHESIEQIAAAGADGVKFQNYRTEDFISDRDLSYTYHWAGGTETESQYDMFKRCELDPSELEALRDHSAEAGLAFLSTPTSDDGIRVLQAAGADGLKNGSDFLTHLPLIEAMARTGLPTVVSTGMATMAEVDDAVRAFRAAGGSDLVLLHCTSEYPTPPADVHLRKMATLRAAFECPVGLSDHTRGPLAAVAAAALGACLIEKHFTPDRSLRGPDHLFSSDQDELTELVKAVRIVESALGSETVGPTASEARSRAQYRISCLAATDLAEDHVLTADDIAFGRPGTGVPPRGHASMTGRVLARAVPKGAVLAPEDFRK